jgi:hypothetical protein
MLSLSTIKALGRQQAQRAARANLLPLVVEEEDMPDDACLGTHLSQVPNFGGYRPKGWRLVEELFVDKTSWGAEGEPALTFGQFLRTVRRAGPGQGYALLEEGDFQVYVGRFEPARQDAVQEGEAS